MRCEKGTLFGYLLLDGAVAEVVRVLLADTNLSRAPQGIEGPKLCLMADIFHTNFVTANNVLGILNSRTVHDSIVVLLGCHPVDLCALIAALEFKLWVILAIDGVDSRLSIVKSLALSLGIIKPTARA